MKRYILMGWMVLGLTIIGSAHPKSMNQFQSSAFRDFDDDGINMGVEFQARLSPYGEWIDARYRRAWRPFSVGPNWRPYLNGRWVWSDYGWYWDSYEPYGWAVYHYGRWEYDDYYGWIWIPDNVWGPSWVEWRYDDDYIGWAPLTLSATFSYGFGITFTHGWVAPIHYWNFVPCRNFTTMRVADYVQPVERTRRFFGNTRGVPNIRTEQNRIINRGVDLGVIERKSGTRIKRVDVVESGRGERIIRDGNRERLDYSRPPRWNDQQPVRVPDEQRQQPVSPKVRQYRESEQRFEIPRSGGMDRSRRGGMYERQQRMNSQDTRPQRHEQERSVAPPQQNPRVRENVIRQAPRERPSNPQVRQQPPSRGNGRRP